jgi:hypothetical protein
MFIFRPILKIFNCHVLYNENTVGGEGFMHPIKYIIIRNLLREEIPKNRCNLKGF